LNFGSLFQDKEQIEINTFLKKLGDCRVALLLAMTAVDENSKPSFFYLDIKKTNLSPSKVVT